MDVRIDPFRLFNSQLNDVMLQAANEAADGTGKSVVKDLMELLNHHGLYGMEAMSFLSELAQLMEKHNPTN